MSKKLVIKINNLEALDEEAIAKKHEVEVLLWGRIIAFVLAVVVVLVGILVLIFSQAEDNVDNGALAEINSAHSSPAAGQAMPPLMAEPEGVAGTALNAELNSGEEPSKIAAVLEETVTPTYASVVANKESPGSIEGEQGLTSPPIEGREEIVEPSEIPGVAASRPAAVGQPADIKLLDSGVVKAQLTHQLDRNKYPVDELGRVVSMKGESLIRVYLFTELENLAGKTMYHSWYRNGDRMAKVRIPVIKEKYHASSSKFIDRFMLGDWQVKITDDNGKSYADVKFTVKDS